MKQQTKTAAEDALDFIAENTQLRDETVYHDIYVQDAFEKVRAALKSNAEMRKAILGEVHANSWYTAQKQHVIDVSSVEAILKSLSQGSKP